jgi:hypothetical protein
MEGFVKDSRESINQTTGNWRLEAGRAKKP